MENWNAYRENIFQQQNPLDQFLPVDASKSPDIMDFDIGNNSINLASLIKSSQTLQLSLMTQESITQFLKSTFKLSFESEKLEMVTWEQFLEFKAFVDLDCLTNKKKAEIWIRFFKEMIVI